MIPNDSEITLTFSGAELELIRQVFTSDRVGFSANSAAPLHSIMQKLATLPIATPINAPVRNS